MNKDSHLETGKKGEDEALNYLVSKGYEIIERNWIFRKKEIDIIAHNNEYIVFVEVKTRSEGYMEAPTEAVTKKKQRFIIQAAGDYIEKYSISKEVRFDVVSITLKKNNFVDIEHIPNAFYPLLK